MFPGSSRCCTVSKSFDNGVIDISNLSAHSLLPYQVVSLGYFLSTADHQKLKELNLSICHIGDHGMSILHQYLCVNKADTTEILEINLSDNNLTGASSPLIADMISHLRIHTLLLHNNKITNVRDIATAVISSFTVKVLTMSLDENYITAQEVGAVSDMMICLEELYISRNVAVNDLTDPKSCHSCQFGSDFGAEVLPEGIKNTKTLRVLHINNIGISGITTITNALVNNSSLEELNFNDNDKFAIKMVRSLHHSNTICKFELPNVPQSYEGVIDINTHILHPHQVEFLGFFLLKSHHRKWKEFNLSTCHIGDHGMSILHKYLCTNKLEITEINLSENYLTGASSPLIADIISHLQVHVLWLHNNDITTNVRDIATVVIVSSTVKVLCLNDNYMIYITTVQAVAISDMMICLEELYLSNNIFNRKLNISTISKGIGSLGAELLSIGITNTKTLRVLHIADNNIGLPGAIAIANALVSNTSLEELNMEYNEIGEDGAKAIAKAKINNKTLQKFYLTWLPCKSTPK